MGLVEPFDDGERLGQHRARIILQRRDQPLRIDREISGRALFALAKMMRQVLGAQALEIERDPDPVGSAAAEIAVQPHRNLPVNLSFAMFGVIDATHIVSMLSINQRTAGGRPWKPCRRPRNARRSTRRSMAKISLRSGTCWAT